MQISIHPLVHISFNQKDYFEYGSITTAIVINNDIFMISSGNHIKVLENFDDMFDAIEYIINLGLHKYSTKVYNLNRIKDGFEFNYEHFIFDGGKFNIVEKKCTYRYSLNKFKFAQILKN